MRKWIMTSLGNAKGTAEAAGQMFLLAPEDSEKPEVPLRKLSGGIVIRSEQGKLADSQDSFLFCGTRIRPDRENFTLTVDFSVLPDGGSVGWETGFGLFVLDTLSSADRDCRFRNMLSVGWHRTDRVRQYGCGIRVVSGYRDPHAAADDSGRLLDASRYFPGAGAVSGLQSGMACRLTLVKTNRGFSARLRTGGREEELTFPGCDFLTRQEAGSIYVGIGAAGKLAVRAENISFRVSSGRSSVTPADAVRMTIPDYPFHRTALVRPAAGTARGGPAELCAAPEGREQGSGDPADPMDLHTALAAAGPHTRIRLLDGIYRPKRPYIVPALAGETSGAGPRLEASHPGKAVLDGSDMEKELPVMILSGSGWTLRGIVFRNSPSAGLLVCGNRNRIEGCEAFGNRDTGILLCAWPGSEERPSNNQIVFCVSHDNCDSAHANADGFGAKLTAGEGNLFLRCIAHHNADDGFDLYAKSVFGPTGAVVLRECSAYRNGHLQAEEGILTQHERGTGFKLGGERQPVPHMVLDCAAWNNDRHGFSANSNPLVQLDGALARGNGEDPETDDIRLVRKKILFLVPHLSGGGAEKVLAQVASGLTDEYAVYLATTVADDGVEEYPVSKKVTRLRLGSTTGGKKTGGRIRKKLRSLLFRGGLRMAEALSEQTRETAFEQRYRGQIAALTKLKQELRPDVSVSFLNSANYLNAMSRGQERCVISVRSCPEGPFAPSDCRSEEGRRRIRDACAAADRIIPVSEETGSCLVSSFGADPEKIRVIYNSTDAERVLELSREDLPHDEAAEMIGRASFVWITAGRLTEKKGQWHIIRAFREVLRQEPGAVLLILGREGKGAENTGSLLKQVIHENGLSGHVLLCGFRSNPYAYMARADAFVMASYNEGFPNALAEAMTLGLPAVAADCRSGPREILAPGTDPLVKTEKTEYAPYGVLVPVCSGRKPVTEPAEPEEALLAEAMCRLTGDPALREHYGKKSRERMQAFRRAEILSQWKEILEEGEEGWQKV